ncbi:MAG: hypothetical protein KF727_11085 [Microbacteriaceae bacterium]|nr:hypothetical protein [Microbacteriaceae bacterium]
MQKHRIISLASILAMLLIPVIGWFLVAQPQLDAASAADQQRADMEAQNRISEKVVEQLKADSQRLPELNGELDALRTSIPFDADATGYLDGLDALAKYSHVDVVALTVEDGVAYTPAVPAGATATDAAATDAAATDAAADGAAADAAAAPPPVEDPAVVTNPLITGSNFVTIPVTVQVSGSWDEVMKFVQGVQSSPRLFLVSSLAVSRDKGTSSFTSTVGGYIYAIPSGVAGHPKPISTTVKQLDSVQAAEEDTVEDDSGTEAGTGTEDGTSEPDPGATQTPEP